MITQVSSLFAAGLLYLAVQTIYRLYFHPLRKIPGPKLAAASSAYEFYFNVIKGGKFIWEIERLHEVYGPIIRIAPTEIHIKDPSYYEEIYAPYSRRREKPEKFYRQFDVDGSAFVTVSSELHRERRTPLSKWFSKSATTDMIPIIHKNLDKLCAQLYSAYKSHKVIKIDAGFASLTSDIINGYFLGCNTGNLDKEDFNESVRDGINGILQNSHLFFFFPFIAKIIEVLPLPVLKWINPFMHALIAEKIRVHGHVVEALSGKRTSEGSVLASVLDKGLPEHLRGSRRLSNDAMSVLTAGTETTARALVVGLFNITKDTSIKDKLREELKSVMPTPQSRPTWDELKQLPYLSGVISETMRLATGVTMRCPRIAPSETLVYGDYTIPPGTTMSQINYFVLMDPTIFPNPHVFDPERWIHAASEGHHLERYLVNFSKGSRNCIGLNLASSEMYLTIATLIRQFDFSLYQTTEKDIEFARDFAVPYPEEGNSCMSILVDGLVQE
ncbi:cytochrome P450 [Penicillium hetheringtonii]|uniref:Cytochrome P450 n=1 Tax=Penicillium hetheringtonii TaxID=911720 RepID=A0AAD6E395_9EURO|nr:cytochrome P450 [Penicillium hetheringtonii]